MKSGNYAIYKGKEYFADFIKNKGIVLRSPDVEDINNGFDIYTGYNKSIACIKFVEQKDLEAFFRVRTKAICLGYEFEVTEENDEMISIVTMKGDYRVWECLGMSCIDKGVYQKWINKNEADIRLEKEVL